MRVQVLTRDGFELRDIPKELAESGIYREVVPLPMVVNPGLAMSPPRIVHHERVYKRIGTLSGGTPLFMEVSA